MNVDLIKFDSVTGRILGRLSAPVDDVHLYLADDPNLIEGVGNALTGYVKDGVILPRPALTISAAITTVVANGTDIITIAGIPFGATCTLTGPDFTQSAKGDGTDLSLTFAIPGEYNLVVEKFPSLPFTVILHAT